MAQSLIYKGSGLYLPIKLISTVNHSFEGCGLDKRKVSKLRKPAGSRIRTKHRQTAMVDIAALF